MAKVKRFAIEPIKPAKKRKRQASVRRNKSTQGVNSDAGRSSEGHGAGL